MSHGLYRMKTYRLNVGNLFVYYLLCCWSCIDCKTDAHTYMEIQTLHDVLYACRLSRADLVFIECYVKFYFMHKYRVRVDVTNFNFLSVNDMYSRNL